MIAASLGTAFSRGPAVEIVPAATPARAFSAKIPDRSVWQISVKRPRETDAVPKGDQSAPPHESTKARDRQIKEIEVAYTSGLRREIVRYTDKTEAVRYIGGTFVVHLDPATGTLLFDDPSDRVMELTYGLDRWGELSWVSPHFFIGTALYLGRQCDVYRQFARPLPSGEQFEDGRQGLASGELNGRKGEILKTAFIDSQTLLPLALENTFETLLYEKHSPYEPFSLPQNVRAALEQRNETIKKREQRFNISR